MRKSFLVMMVIFLSAGAAYSADLSMVCLKTSIDSILGSSTTIDTAGLPKLSATGTCDSVTLYYDTIKFTQKIAIPILVAKKLSPCSLKITIVLSSKDSVYDVCGISSIRSFQSTARATLGQAAFSATQQGNKIVVVWNSANMGSVADVTILTMRGEAVATSYAVKSGSTLSLDKTTAFFRSGQYQVLLKCAGSLYSQPIMVIR